MRSKLGYMIGGALLRKGVNMGARLLGRKMFGRKRRYRRRKVYRRVNRAISMQDRKYFDEQATVTAVYAGNVYTMLNTTQGTGESQHVGDDIYIKGVALKFELFYNASGTNPQFVRLMIVRAYAEKGVTPAIGDIFVSGDLGAATATIARRNWYRSKYYQVLWDRTFKLANTDSTICKRIIRYVKVNRKAKYTSGSSTFDNGGLYFVVVGDEPLNGPSVAFKFRSFFSG